MNCVIRGDAGASSVCARRSIHTYYYTRVYCSMHSAFVSFMLFMNNKVRLSAGFSSNPLVVHSVTAEGERR